MIRTAKRHLTRLEPSNRLALLLLLPAIAALSALAIAAPLPPDRAARILSARNLGLAQLEEGKTKEARKTFDRLAELVPDDPLPWANGAIAALRDNDLVAAEKLLDRARKAGGPRPDLEALRATIEEAKNHPEEARAALSRAAALDPRDLESRWRLVRSIETLPAQTPPQKEARRKALAEISAASPANLPARLKLLLAGLEAADAAIARKDLAEVRALLEDADPKTKQFLAEASAFVEKGDLRQGALKARILENLLRVTPRYQQSLAELQTNVVGMPMAAFAPALESALRPQGGAAIPLSFRVVAVTAEDPAITVRRVDLKNTGKPEIYAIPAPFTGAAFFDFDLDGDLDVYLYGGGRADRLLRNNLDGTWADVTGGTGDPEFASRDVVVGDFDRDGDLDLAAIDAKGNVVLRSNLRQGRFRTIALGVKGALALAADDLNADGALDLVIATKEGVVVLINKGDGTFVREESADLARVAELSPRSVVLADLDNDGFPDLVVSGEKGMAAFRRTGPSAFRAWAILPAGIPPASRMIALDVDHDGDLDLVLHAGAKTVVLQNDGGNANGWLDVVLEGLPTGSGKVNRAGVGSQVEVKAGDLYVAKTVGVLPTHIGLGTRTKADVVRVLFTNGVPQNSFDQRARSTVREIQQLKGSCPFVYAYDGEMGTWSFVSDALGNAPLGLLYDGVHTAGAVPREWLFVDGSLLRETRDHKLLLDYTEELWEVAFLDEATLMAVDHPEGTGIVPNERMVPFALPKTLHTVANRRDLRGAWSETGGRKEDVTASLGRKDGVYVDPGPETYYQGIREEHALVLDLGPIPEKARVVLFMTGWIFYTDTSINVSISQRSDLRPFPPVLEVPDGAGGWKTALPSFGFPAGKTKTIPVDLTGLVDPADPRVRIRTNLAIYWDEAYVTVDDPPVAIVTTALSPAKATLSVRGFSRRYRETQDGPHLFDHSDVTQAPLWEDVPGRLTRLGDVTELLQTTDDRWVAFQGGDAIRLEYDASTLPPLKPGWRRDWILISDGWDKDFDRNTVTGQSVEPWPFHGMSRYPYPDSESHPDPAFLREWLTRPTGPEAFRGALRESRSN